MLLDDISHFKFLSTIHSTTNLFTSTDRKPFAYHLLPTSLHRCLYILRNVSQHLHQGKGSTLYLTGFLISHFLVYFRCVMARICPSTFGIHGFLKLNSTGAKLSDISFEYIALLVQIVIYFISACLIYRHRIKQECV